VRCANAGYRDEYRSVVRGKNIQTIGHSHPPPVYSIFPGPLPLLRLLGDMTTGLAANCNQLIPASSPSSSDSSKALFPDVNQLEGGKKECHRDDAAEQ
jgi:hypothetical protein